ncbi:MAG TPA: FAD:protein FMN transferase [Dehalococcoidia bacterium]|jgi:thiamine biosynthesis lipoprotein
MLKEAVATGESYVASAVFMDTLITVEVVRPKARNGYAERVQRAFGWFGQVERLCSRFDETSELSRLSASPAGVPVTVSPPLFELVSFALSVAQASNGAFDPTVGREMEMSGFNRNYLTGERKTSATEASAGSSYRDVLLDPVDRTVTLTRPFVLDLGAVAKGFAIDLAAEELRPFQDYAINAGGDILARGLGPEGTPWRIGIRHPRQPEALIDTFTVSDAAVCTSGDYERPRPDGGPGHHLLDPETGRAAAEVASVTVVAATAMLADALSTAAFVLGAERGIGLLERQNVEGLIVSVDLQKCETKGLSRYRR